MSVKTLIVRAGVNAVSCPRKGCKETAFVAVPLFQLAALQAGEHSKYVRCKCARRHISNIYIRSNTLRGSFGEDAALVR